MPVSALSHLVLDMPVLGLGTHVLRGGGHPSFTVLLRSDHVARFRCLRLRAELYSTVTRFLGSLFVDLGCFQFLTLMNRTAVGVLVQVTVRLYVLVPWADRSGTAWVTGWGVSQPFPHWLLHSLANPGCRQSFLFSAVLVDVRCLTVVLNLVSHAWNGPSDLGAEQVACGWSGGCWQGVCPAVGECPVSAFFPTPFAPVSHGPTAQEVVSLCSRKRTLIGFLASARSVIVGRARETGCFGHSLYPHLVLHRMNQTGYRREACDADATLKRYDI